MPLPNRDTVLLETVKTQRSRLLAAFLFGPLAQRRVANDNVKRLIGGVVLAATICAGCLGVSFVTSLKGWTVERDDIIIAIPICGSCWIKRDYIWEEITRSSRLYVML